MKDPLRIAVIGVSAVVAIAVAAVGLETTTLIGEPGDGGPGRGAGGGVNGGEVATAPGDAVAIPYLPEFVSILLVVAVVVFVAITFVYWREALILFLSVLLFASIVLALHWLIGGSQRSALAPLIEPVAEPGGGGGGVGAETITPPPMIVLLFIGVGLAVAVTLYSIFRRSGAVATASGDEDTEPDRAEAVGAAAGRAADRLESAADVENEVYRAWRDMTELFDVTNPETSTPGEFAQAAVDSGIDERDVDHLTRLFEDVRYGETAATAAYEEQALETFRRIETRYAGPDT